MRKATLRTSMMALLFGAMAAGFVVPALLSSPVHADDKGKNDKAKTVQPKEVPANCARIIKATERQKCLLKSGN